MLQTEVTFFDKHAPSYDEAFTFSAIGNMQRERVRKFPGKYLQEKKLNILEINCGTGEDALWLAGMGHEVTATDRSGRMIEICKEKNFGNEIRNSKFEICEFSRLQEKFIGKKYDLIFSNFGGLNCVDELELKKLSGDFAQLLNPGGKFIAIVMGKICLWEQFYFILKLNFAKAYRRLGKNGVALKGTGEKVFYYSPAEFRRMFSLNFKSIETKPVGLFIPPSYLDPFFKNKIFLLRILAFFEKVFSWSIFSNLADHYFISMERRINQ